jgi:chromosome segregation ATPase
MTEGALSTKHLTDSDYALKDMQRFALPTQHRPSSRAKDSSELFIQKLEEAQTEIERAHQQILDQSEALRRQASQISEMQTRMTTSFHSETVSGELRRKEEELGELRYILKNKDKALDALSLNYQNTQQRMMDLEVELESKCEILEALQGKVRSTEQAIQELADQRRSESSLFTEIDQLKADNSRLLELLSSAKEFRELSGLIEDSEGARYLPICQKGKACPLFEECKNWVPSKAYSLTHQLMKDSGRVTSELLDHLLSELNLIWREREHKQIARYKAAFTYELAAMKRQLTMQRPYDGVQSHKEISRLKRELNDTKQRLKTATSTTKAVPAEFQHVKDVLSAILKSSPENKPPRKGRQSVKSSRVVESFAEECLKDSEDSDSRIYF